jgi:23S rRNA (uracil1939-C5)-methyltransferase
MTRATIEALGHKGDGLALVGTQKLHISKVLAGEVVELVEARLSRVLTPSPERVDPFCPHYATCGGCKFQHWADAPYQAWKSSLLADALSAKGIDTNLHALVDAHGEGRRRVNLHVRQHDGVWVAGFMEQRSHDLVALQQCPVLTPSLRGAPLVAAEFGTPFGICDVAITAADNGLDVSVKAERQVVLRRLEALNAIMRKHNIIRLSVNGETHVAATTPMVRMGKAYVPLPVTSFLQATAKGEAVLADLVLQGVGKAKTVADLFCGIGPFALRLAETAKVFAYDNDKSAIESIQAALRNTQGLKPVTAKAWDLFRDPLTPLELNAFDAVVMDPPRAGAEAQCRMLVKSKVQKVVMVSCDVANFARDAALLKTGGFTLKQATPVDQFKWTAHLEMVGVFERSS